MTHRKGEITRSDLQRQWPHHVALPADKVRGHKNYDAVHTFAEAFSVEPRTFWVRRDDLNYVVFCFGKAEDAEAFCEQFGGERLPVSFDQRSGPAMSPKFLLPSAGIWCILIN